MYSLSTYILTNIPRATTERASVVKTNDVIKLEFHSSREPNCYLGRHWRRCPNYSCKLQIRNCLRYDEMRCGDKTKWFYWNVILFNIKILDFSICPPTLLLKYFLNFDFLKNFTKTLSAQLWSFTTTLLWPIYKNVTLVN